MARRVVVIGDAACGAEAAQALTARGFEAAAAAEEALGASGADAVVVAAPPGAQAAATVARLVRSKPCPPVIVRLAGADPASRDQCLIQGAADVSFGTTDELASRVQAVVEGWTRETERRGLQAKVRAQRGREKLELRTCDVDATGLGLATAEGLTPGELVRLALPMPTGGELVTWGRIASASGSPGVRFLGLAPEDAERVRAAIGGRRPVPAPSPEPVVEPAPPASVPSVPSPTDSISAALSEVLEPPAPVVETPSEADVLAGLLDSALVRRWPSEAYDPVASLASLRKAASSSAIDVPGAPPAAAVAVFAKSLSSIERRAFEGPGIADFGDPALATRCLALRLRLAVLAKDADQKLAQAPSGWVIDEQVLQALAAEVKAADAELQKVSDARMAKADTAGLKDVTNFRSALNRAHADLKSAAARMKGETHEAAGNAALLDVAERDPNAPASARRREAPKEPEKPRQERRTVVDGGVGTDGRRRRGLLIGWAVAVVALAVFAVVSWPDRVDVLGGKQLEGLPGVTAVLLPEGAREGTSGAVVKVDGAWSPTEAELRQLRRIVREHGAKTFVVSGPSGEVLGISGSGEGDAWKPMRGAAAK